MAAQPAGLPTLPVRRRMGSRPHHVVRSLDDEDMVGSPDGDYAPSLRWGIVVLLFVAYAVSRLWALSALPIFFDEAHYTLSALLIGRHPLRTDPFIEVAYWGVPPLFTWLAAPVTRLVADPLLAGRLTSVLIGAIGLVGVYRCGRVIGGAVLATLACAFYVMCPFFVLYHRMAMVDGLLATIGAFALLIAMRLARVPSPRTGLMLGLLLAAAILTKIIGPLLLVLPLAAVIAAAPGARRVVARQAALAALIGLAAVAFLLAIPEGASLVAVTGQQQRLSAPFVVRTIAQATIIAQSFWLYLTPPVLLLALMGLTRAWRTPETRVLSLWAFLSTVPFALMHLNLSSRYLLCGAVPVALLAARGAVILMEGEGRQPLRRIVAVALVAVAVGTCLVADMPQFVDPARAALVPNDRQQYIAGWPSGYALAGALDAVRRLAHGHPLTLISSVRNPPGDALSVLVGDDPRVHLVFTDFAALAHPGALVRYPPATFVVACRPTGQPLDARRARLRLVAISPNRDGVGGVYVYAPVSARAARRSRTTSFVHGR